MFGLQNLFARTLSAHAVSVLDFREFENDEYRAGVTGVGCFDKTNLANL